MSVINNGYNYLDHDVQNVCKCNMNCHTGSAVLQTNTLLVCHQILKEIEENDIGIYRFPDLCGEDDEDVAAVSMKV